MISKGTTHNNGTRLAAYMTTGKDGERAELYELRGFEATNIKDAFRDVEIMAGATRCEQPFFHVQVRNRDGEELTREQWRYAADGIGRMLGLVDQPRAIAFHIDEKTGHEHMHLAFSRIDEDSLKAIPLPFFKDRLKKISRELEVHFALEPVTNKREGHIKFAPTRAEDEQGRRLGQNPHELRDTIRACWDRSDCGTSFQAALEYEGFILAQGERRDFVVVDRAGGLHSLGKRILDVGAAKVRDRLSDLSRDDLPTVEMARVFAEDLAQEKPKERKQEKTAPAWDRDLYDRTWQEAVIHAAIEKEKVERQFVEPEKRRTGTEVGSRNEKASTIGTPTPEPIRSSAARSFEGAAAETLTPATELRSEPVKRHRETRHVDNVRQLRNATEGVSRTLKSSIKRTVGVSEIATRTIGKALEFATDAFASLLAPTLTPDKVHEGEKARDRREAEAERTIDYSAYTAEIAAQRQRQEREREVERQQSRDRGGRDR